MAKIKFGMMMTDARGKLGGQVFSKNRGGAYIRTKVTPSNPRSTFQQAIRSLLSTFSQQWSALTEAQRASWNGAVANWSKTDIFGDIKNPTGKNLFVRLNNKAVNAGYASMTDAPEKAETPLNDCTGVVVNISATTIDLVGLTGIAGARVIVSATPQLTAGTSNAKNKFRQIYNAVSNAVVDTDLFNAYKDRFGTPVAGANIQFAVELVLPNGQSSVPASYTVTVQA